MASESTAENLSDEIKRQMPKRPEDELRVSHLYGSYYRCNWWCRESTDGYDNPAMKGGQLGTTYRVRASKFLSATRVNGQVVISEMHS